MSFARDYILPPPPSMIHDDASSTSSRGSSTRYDNNPRRMGEVERKRPKYTRSKTGCLTCRVKKVKCDEVHPVCTRCDNGNRDCTWPENVPTRKKTIASRKDSLDRCSNPDSSGLSDMSTPPTRHHSPAPTKLQTSDSGAFSQPHYTRPPHSDSHVHRQDVKLEPIPSRVPPSFSEDRVHLLGSSSSSCHLSSVGHHEPQYQSRYSLTPVPNSMQDSRVPNLPYRSSYYGHDEDAWHTPSHYQGASYSHHLVPDRSFMGHSSNQLQSHYRY
ncbi:hypothetical protein CC2G_009002 [Coprinopsis cinerea AmutBmut pab1-1]|nr:hypothetical protein CC2G_009002 [Coprinopsis cinerea AmutBmut pab1-1]